jgi:WD40 repeat protein
MKIKVYKFPSFSYCKPLRLYQFLLLTLLSVGNHAIGPKKFEIQSYNIIDTVGPYKTPLHYVAFSPDAKRVAGCGDDNNITVWRADSNKVYRTLKGHKGKVNCVAFSEKGEYLASASEDGTVIVWSLAKNKAIKTFSPEGVPLGKGKNISFVCFGKDDKDIMFGGEDKILTRIHNPLGAGSSSRAGSAAEGISCGVYSPDNKWFAYASTSLIYILNTANAELKVIAGSSSDIVSLSFRPDDKVLASKCRDRYIEFWDLRTSVKAKTIKPVYDIKGVDNTQIKYSPDGKYIATGSLDNSPQVWDAEDYKALYTLKGHSGPVRSLDFSRDGRLVATASEDKTIRIWYLAEAAMLAEENQKLTDNAADRERRKKKGEPYNDSDNLESNVRYAEGNIPLSLNGRKVTASRPVEVASKNVSLYVWDDDQVDGDIISLNFNGKWVLNNFKLGKKKKVVNVVLDEKGNNFLLLYAHNEGDTPPNTAGISIYDGSSETRLVLKSDLKTCDAVRLKLK